MNYSYQIDPRSEELGGGWRLRLLEDGDEVGGGVFPLGEYLDENNDAEMASTMAYSDALSEGQAWVSSRGFECARCGYVCRIDELLDREACPKCKLV